MLTVLGVGSIAHAQSANGNSVNASAQPIELIIRPGGQRSLTPLAVPTTRVEAGMSGLPDVDGMLHRGLELAGYFEILSSDRFYFDVAKSLGASINYQNWANVGASGLVATSVEASGKKVKLDYRLYDVTSNQEISLKWKPKTVKASQVRGETYDFINAVIEYYTGSPGPFGGRLAFAARGHGGFKQIYTIGIDGFGLSSVTRDNTIHLLPGWGPGGNVMYTSYKDNNPDIWIGSRDSAKKLISYKGINSGPALSPDGREIAVTLSKDGDPEIFITDTNGEILRKCTDAGSADLSPTWSPDGSKIAFVSDRTGSPQIYVMNRDCSGQHRITKRGEYNVSPDWSPSGNKIAFTGRAGGRFDIFTINPTTGDIERITQGQGSNYDPTWSPDGRYLAFASTRGGGGARLYLSTADGQIQNAISDEVVGVESPRWKRH